MNTRNKKNNNNREILENRKHFSYYNYLANYKCVICNSIQFVDNYLFDCITSNNVKLIAILLNSFSSSIKWTECMASYKPIFSPFSLEI